MNAGKLAWTEKVLVQYPFFLFLFFSFPFFFDNCGYNISSLGLLGRLDINGAYDWSPPGRAVGWSMAVSLQVSSRGYALVYPLRLEYSMILKGHVPCDS